MPMDTEEVGPLSPSMIDFVFYWRTITLTQKIILQGVLCYVIFRVRNYWVSGFPRHPKIVLETQNLGLGFRLETLGKWYEHRHAVYRWKALILISMLSSIFACKIKHVKGPMLF